MNMLRNQYGRYQVEASEEFDGLIFEWHKYENSSKIKQLGGQYANYCADTGNIKFYKNAYIRDKAFPGFIDESKIIEGK